MLSFFINIYKKQVKKQISTEILSIHKDLTEKKVSKKDLLFENDLIEEQILSIHKKSMEKEKIYTYTTIIRILFQNNYLTSNEIIHLDNLTKDQLIEIIKIYNDLNDLTKNQNDNLKKNYQKFEDLSQIYLPKTYHPEKFIYKKSFTNEY